MLSMDYIVHDVDRLTRRYMTRDPFELCSALGVDVHYMDLGLGAKAFYVCNHRVRNVVLNSRVSKVVQRVLLAHELGHDRLHQDIPTIKQFRKVDAISMAVSAEYEANLFAADLLIDDDELLNLLYYDDRTFYTIARELLVPYPLLEFKLRILKHKGHNIDAPYEANGDFLKNAITGCFGDEW